MHGGDGGGFSVLPLPEQSEPLPILYILYLLGILHLVRRDESLQKNNMQRQQEAFRPVSEVSTRKLNP